MSQLCSCGSHIDFDDCCGGIINGTRQADTAEQLMRSRYTAFTMVNVDYLMRSHSSKTRPVGERKNIEHWAKSVVWMGLSIIRTEAGEANEETGSVEFKATFLEAGQHGRIHEKSLFQRENGKWVYVSGMHIEPLK